MTDSDDIPSNPRIAAGAKTIGNLIDARLSRRGFLSSTAAAGFITAACAPQGIKTKSVTDEFAFSFSEITRGSDETLHVPDGYVADIVIRWGDPLFKDSPEFTPDLQRAEAQVRQFGFNNDFIGIVPLDPAEDGEARMLLCVNHEFTSTHLMFPGILETYPQSMTHALCDAEITAHGGTIVELAMRDGKWTPVVGSAFNRRITGDTPIEITGPAAGHPRLQTSEDPEGQNVRGTINNCAGGITPWGSYLMAEENFNGNFLGELPEGHPEAEAQKRYGIPGGWYQWGRHFERFDVSKEPNEPNRFGWIVEVDPMDPTSTPKKRTALGRFKHEGAESIVAPDGRVVIYMGDDQRFDYLYKFVTARGYSRNDPAANADLLDDGVLYVAQFQEDGVVDWLALTFGEGPLTSVNGFQSQADVLIETRRAADLLGATPMDRPEDVEPHPGTGRVYVMLTNNSKRTEDDRNAANPRANNVAGHIIEIIEPDKDFTATQSRWEFLVKCGDPSDPTFGATWNPLTSENGWFGSPDNCAIDPSGRLWVATDGNEKTGAADGLWAIETEGPARGTSRAFFRAPVGAEVCGPRFTPDGKTVFVSVQHPGDGDGASYENPTTRWPDFEDGKPPRSAVVAIRREDGGVIGG